MCVGLTAERKRCEAAGLVHPHICGAHTNIFPLRNGIDGSSPHAWGLHRQRQESDVRHRFIPTYVGFTTGIRRGHTKMSRFIPTYVGFTPYAGQRMQAWGNLWAVLALRGLHQQHDHDWKQLAIYPGKGHFQHHAKGEEKQNH